MQKIDIQEGFELTKPLPYTIITLLDAQQQPNAIGVSWVTRTSIEPPMVLISIGHERYSHKGLQSHPEFVVNYPHGGQIAEAWYCGVKSGRNQDKIANAGFALIKSHSVAVPTLKDVTVALECKTVSSFETGDHTVFVGRVQAATANSAAEGRLFDLAGKPVIALNQEGKIVSGE